MAKTVQIRDVDDHTYEVLKRRAKEQGMSLAHYMRREMDQMASLPTMGEWLARADERRTRHGGLTAEQVQDAIDDLRHERESR
jgi:hypothetical protein